MKLVNLNEEAPDFFYVFVNLDNVVTKNNFEVCGMFNSATIPQLADPAIREKYGNGTLDYLPFVINPDRDLQMVSMFHNRVTSEYRTEYNCEVHRKWRYPLYPSRLSAVYAFGDFETCKLVQAKYHWNLNSVKKFKLDDSPFNRVAKVNMEVVSMERTANRISSLDIATQEQIWDWYWTGGGDFQMELPTVNDRKIFQSGVIWEYLVEGTLIHVP